MGSCSEVSIPVINFKKGIEQNPNLNAIANHCFDLMADSKAKVDVVVQNIARFLHTVDRKKLDDALSLKIVPDDLDSVLLKNTMALIHLQQDRISNWRQSIEQRRIVYNVAIMIAFIIMLAVSVGLEVAGKRKAALATTALAMAIKAVESPVNGMLNEEERMLKEDEELVKMMRDGEWLMVHEFNNVQQKAKTLNEQIMVEHSKLMGYIHQRMEESETKATIKKIKRTLKDLKNIVNGYGNQVHEFSRKFTNMVRN